MAERMAFDYVIVGGGSAGCVLANRLSEDPQNSVCLIEAGGRDRSPFIHIPAGMVALMRHPTLNWRYETAPQPAAQGRNLYVPRGKVLGGSSAINGMIYMRGHPLDYEDWAAQGNTGWAFRDVLPYFKRSEHNEIFGDTLFHATGGPLNISKLKSFNPLTDAFFQATDSLQLPRREDVNGDDSEGFGFRQLNIKNGRRQSSATAYIDPARGRKNLTIITQGHVDKVTLDGARASGVEMLIGNNERRHIAAQREVILAAGAIGSPAILMRSGIGDSAALSALGIEAKHHLPAVGRNLQDHLASPVKFSSPGSESYSLSWRKAPWLVGEALKYVFARRGFFAGNNLEAGGFIRTDPNGDRPDIQLGFLPAVLNHHGGVVGAGRGFSILNILLRPKSKGALTLASADPRAMPSIDPGFLSNEEDLLPLIRGFRLARRIALAPAFDRYRGNEFMPGPDAQSEDELKDYVRNFSGSVFHPVGTCRMGSDTASVVDPSLRVRGIAGLRVIDVSIMPTIIGGNTHAPAVMIGEKGSDLVLGKLPLPAANVAVRNGRVVALA